MFYFSVPIVSAYVKGPLKISHFAEGSPFLVTFDTYFTVSLKLLLHKDRRRIALHNLDIESVSISSPRHLHA